MESPVPPLPEPRGSAPCTPRGFAPAPRCAPDRRPEIRPRLLRTVRLTAGRTALPPGRCGVGSVSGGGLPVRFFQRHRYAAPQRAGLRGMRDSAPDPGVQARISLRPPPGLFPMASGPASLTASAPAIPIASGPASLTASAPAIPMARSGRSRSGPGGVRRIGACGGPFPPTAGAPPLDPGVWGGAPVTGRGGEGRDPPDTP
ncbi:hypothetical protein SMALA_1949 [Streptomyces malaysiensis subsp. malaysiensis]|nr:hypothetical protein SMALA_1949 [Streptomyces malaysiensis]